MTKRDELLALAARVEAATGADWELDAAIGAAVGRVTDDGIVIAAGYVGVGAFTASLDAAERLVPANSLWHVGEDIDGPVATICRPMRDGYVGGAMDPAYAATPALALTVASLRALASQEPDDAE